VFIFLAYTEMSFFNESEDDQFSSWTSPFFTNQNLEGHAYARWLSDDEYRLVEDLTWKNVRPREILSTLKDQNENNLSTLSTIYDAQHKIRKIEYGGKTSMQVLMSLLHINRYVYEPFINPVTNKLQALFFVHPTSYEIWRAFPHVLIIDATYKTNIYKMPFVQIVGVTSTGKTFCIAFVFISEEKMDNYKWALEQLKLTLNECMHPRVIVTDRELALMKACKIVFPQANHLLCRWHIGQNIWKHCRRTIRSNRDWDHFQSMWKLLEDSPTWTSYTENYEKLRTFLSKYPHFYDVRGDGNCGFRSVALGLGLSEDQWPQVRLDIVRELMAHRERYIYVFGSLGFDNIYKTVETAGAWMIMPNTGLVIASAYNRVVILLANGGSVGASAICFPLWSSPPQSQPRENIVIAHVNGNHYIRVTLREVGRLQQGKVQEVQSSVTSSGDETSSGIVSDEEIDKQKLEAHYSYMAKIQEVSPKESSSTSQPLEQVQNHDENDVFANVRRHSEQPESINDTYVLKRDDSNVTPDSSNKCTNDNQIDQNAAECVDERDAHANLIANLTLDTEENKTILKQLKKANRIID
ncbi:FAR1-related sequence 5-like protein, partial [Tanacetum coccineum]